MRVIARWSIVIIIRLVVGLFSPLNNNRNIIYISNNLKEPLIDIFWDYLNYKINGIEIISLFKYKH